MKYFKLFDNFKSSDKILFELIHKFNEINETSWYVQGGCYDFSITLGKLIENKLKIKPIYGSYGSEEEPYVHMENYK